MRVITFNELHIYKNSLADFRYFIVTGVCEPVLTYIRHYLDEACKKSGVNRLPQIDRAMYRRLGYDEEMIAEYEEQITSSSDYFEKASLEDLYSLNIFNVPRLCEIDLQATSADGRGKFIEHIKTTELSDNLLEWAPNGAYCITYFDTSFDLMDEVKKKDIVQLRNTRKDLDALKTSLINEDARNTGRTSRVLWIDASVWNATRRGMYSWACDLLTDKATEEYLWECMGACGELTMLKGFYEACTVEAENKSRLGAGLNKAQIRKTELYESLLYIDGRAFGWDALRYYADKKYKGRTLRSEVARSLQIEHAGLQANTYRQALNKCMNYLVAGKRYIEKLFKIRCLLESGALSMSLGKDALRSKECRELCQKYGLSIITREDLECAAKYDLFLFRDVLTILNKENSYGNRVLKDATALREISDGDAPPIQPMLRVFLALDNHRKLVELCS